MKRLKFVIFLIIIIANMILAVNGDVGNEKSDIDKFLDGVSLSPINFIPTQELLPMMAKYQISVVDINAKEKLHERLNIPIYNIKLSKELQIYTWKTCTEFDFNYDVAIAIMGHETGETYDPNSISLNKDKKGRVISKDLGLFQLNNRYMYWYGELAGIPKEEFDVFDPYDNIRGGVAGLAYFRDYWKNKGIKDEGKLMYYTLNSYNMGALNYQNNYVKETGSLSRGYDRDVNRIKNNLELQEGENSSDK